MAKILNANACSATGRRSKNAVKETKQTQQKSQRRWHAAGRQVETERKTSRRQVLTAGVVAARQRYGSSVRCFTHHASVAVVRATQRKRGSGIAAVKSGGVAVKNARTVRAQRAA